MVDLTAKKLSYVNRLSIGVIAVLDEINNLVALDTEYVQSGFAPVSGDSPPATAITDNDLNAVPTGGGPARFPHLAATDLAAAVASLGAIKQFMDANFPNSHTANLGKLRP